MPTLWPFTDHEVRFARAIGAVLSTRYRTVLHARIIAERGDLFRGSVLAALASLDGATVVDRDGRLLAAGAILRYPPIDETRGEAFEGARTTAAVAASRFGPVLKVSEDGIITFFDGDRVWDV